MHSFIWFLVPAPNGTLVQMDGRDERLPQYFRFDSHPLLAHVQGVRNVYIYLQDTRPSAMSEYYDYVKEQEFPDGTKTALDQAGTFSCVQVSDTCTERATNRFPGYRIGRLYLRARHVGFWRSPG